MPYCFAKQFRIPNVLFCEAIPNPVHGTRVLYLFTRCAGRDALLYIKARMRADAATSGLEIAGGK